jgi:hypothetical protein
MDSSFTRACCCDQLRGYLDYRQEHKDEAVSQTKDSRVLFLHYNAAVSCEPSTRSSIKFVSLATYFDSRNANLRGK